MVTYEDTFSLSPDITLGTLGTIEDEVMAVGQLIASKRDKIAFKIEADDLWDLRGTLDDLADTLRSYQVDLTVDRANIGPRDG